MADIKQYQPTYYQEQLQRGLEYQDFVTDKLFELGISLNCYSSQKYQNEKGENKTGIEIKLDNKMKQTGNLFIEYAEKRNKENEFYIPSGIERNDNTWLYAIGDYDTIYIIDKRVLQDLKTSQDVTHVTTSTSKGYLLTENMARKYSAKIIHC